MAFLPLDHHEGRTALRQAATGQTIVKGDALVDNGSGYLVPASAGGNVDIRFVAAETVTTTADGQNVLVWSTDGVTFVADTDANPAQTDVGTEADLAAAGQVDPDASTDDIFVIERILGAVSDKKVIGHFTRGTPNA